MSRALVNCLASAAVFALSLFGISAATASATGSPQLQLRVTGAPTNFASGSSGERPGYFIYATNVGDGPTSTAQIVLSDTLPPGVSAKRVIMNGIGAPGSLELPLQEAYTAEHCTLSPLRCVYPGPNRAEDPPLRPGQSITMFVWVEVESSVAEGTMLTDSAAVTGGGSPSATSTTLNEVSATPAPFGIHQIEISAANRDGTPYTQAGGHPYQLTTSVYLNTDFSKRETFTEQEELGIEETPAPSEESRDIWVDLPPGAIGNPQAVTQCTLAELWSESISVTGGVIPNCPNTSQVGTVNYQIFKTRGYNGLMATVPLYNMKPAPGNAAQLGYDAHVGIPFVLSASLRSGGDYGLRIGSAGLPEVALRWVSVTTWGVPNDPRHNPQRGQVCLAPLFGCGGGGLTAGGEPTAFLRLPTSCSGSPLSADSLSDSWLQPEALSLATTTFSPSDGCNAVPFKPTLQARPTTTQADSPSGLDLHLHLPQGGLLASEGVGASDLRDAVVELPAGLRLNPASASDLQACDESQIGYKPGTENPLEFTPGPAECPDASKLGSVEVDTPLLDHPLPGALYLAQPHGNPFDSLLAAYLTIDDPETGVVVKLAGRIEANPETGRLTTIFRENPQTPFEDLRVHLFGGALGALRTPSVCGAYDSSSILTPWSAPESGPPAEPIDEFQIAGNCAQNESSEPHNPLFHAGTESPQAGKFSPFAFKLSREDGSQELSKIETVLPPGLTGKLAGVAECPESAIAQARSREHGGGGAEELTAPSCPASSELGSVEVGVGPGPDPYYTGGRAYLAGPYEGAPLSLVILTPAVAGPFDLGDVVVRTALFVNPETAQITAKSDPIPRIIDGIPLDVRSVTLKLNRPQFTLNPTSCNPMAISGSAASVFGAIAALAQRFQVGGCKTLPFKPKLTLRLKGKTTRSGFPALTATLKMKPGEANVAAAQVTLPHSAFLANAHIDKTCRRPELESHSCPARALYGHAKAWSPLLDRPLEGNVYLVTGFGYELPALVADLNGQIEVHLVGKVDTGREDGIRNTFEVVPDAPVSKFVLEMAGGKKSLIENHENLCAKHAKRKALAEFTAQNGKVWDVEPVVKVKCRGKHHARRRHR